MVRLSAQNFNVKGPDVTHDLVALNWRAEIRTLNAQIRQIRARVRSLESACRNAESVEVGSRLKRSRSSGQTRDQRSHTGRDRAGAVVPVRKNSASRAK